MEGGLHRRVRPGCEYVPWIVVVHLVHRRSVVATEGAVARLPLARDWVGHGPLAVLVVDDDLDWPRAGWEVWNQKRQCQSACVCACVRLVTTWKGKKGGEMASAFGLVGWVWSARRVRRGRDAPVAKTSAKSSRASRGGGGQWSWGAGVDVRWWWE